MARPGVVPPWKERLEGEGRGRPDSGVDQDHPPIPDQVEGHLRLELNHGKPLRSRRQGFGRQPLDKQGSEGVVTTGGVTDRQDEGPHIEREVLAGAHKKAQEEVRKGGSLLWTIHICGV